MPLRNVIAALLLGLCAVWTGCASVGPPLPPSLELPKPPNDLRATRKGDRVTLTWTAPSQTTDRQSVRYLGPTRICRAVDAALIQCDSQVGEAPIPAENSPTLQQQGKRVLQQYIDTLPAALMRSKPFGMASYAVEVYNRDGRGAGISNQVRVPVAPTLPPPTDFQAQNTPDGVQLSWQGSGAAQPLPQISYRYHIFRREADSPKEVMAGDVAVEEPGPVRYLDHTFEWEKTYLYRVSVVTIVSTGFQPCPPTAPAGADCMGAVEIEGDDTPAVRIFAHDVFAPAIPTGLQAVFSGPGQKPFIDLIWAPAVQEDLLGYNIYRREEGAAPVKVNADLVKTPAFRDDSVVGGKQYFYAVTSVDARGNESARSDEASERVPQ
jgi:hypothetical protein